MNIKSIAIQGAVLLALGGATSASAEVIFNTGSAATATIALGVNPLGNLNTSVGSVATVGYTGIAYKFPDGSWRDATSPGCLCEGWGVSAGAVSGYANAAAGSAGLVSDSFTATAANITSVVHLSALPGLSVTQSYSVSPASTSAFVNHVTITNTTGGALTDVRYVRVMDWDVPPTEFSELVTIAGTATTTLLELSHDDGFESSNPLASTGAILPGTTNVDFVDSGPADHGAYFKFNFGTLAAGASYSFDVFYGAAGTETGALAALGAIGPELYSLGQSFGPASATSPTFFFAFKGVGGSVITPPTGVSEPSSLALLGLGLLGVGLSRTRRRS